MEKPRNVTRSDIAAFVVLVLFIGMFVYLTIVLGMNDRLADNLNEERLEAELLLSEKLQEQKRAARLTEELSSHKRQERIEKEKGTQILKLLSETDAELKHERLRKPYALIERQNKEIRMLTSKLAEDSSNRVVQIHRLNSELNLLRSQLAEKTSEQQKYMSEIDRLKEIQIDEVAVQSMKKSNKLTSKAAKADYINISIQVSAHLESISVKIVDPLGLELPVNDETTEISYGAVEAVPVSHAFMVSPDLQLKATEARRTVDIFYKTKSKLRAGVYKILLSGDNQSLGKVRLRLE